MEKPSKGCWKGTSANNILMAYKGSSQAEGLPFRFPRAQGL